MRASAVYLFIGPELSPNAEILAWFWQVSGLSLAAGRNQFIGLGLSANHRRARGKLCPPLAEVSRR